MASLSGLTFDDSWMDEATNEGVNTLGEYCDDDDVIAKHLQEAEEARQLELAPKVKKDQEGDKPTEDVPTEQAIRDGATRDVSVEPPLLFDDSWMDEATNEGVNTLGEYHDDNDVIAKHLQEAEEAQQLEASLQEAAGPSVGWVVRVAAASEAPRIVALVNSAYSDGEGDVWEEGPAFIRTTLTEVGTAVASGKFLVCEGKDVLDPIIVGCVSLSPLGSVASNFESDQVSSITAMGTTAAVDGGACATSTPATSSAGAGTSFAVCEFGMLAVLREWRGKGIALALVAACEQHAMRLYSSPTHATSQEVNPRVLLQCELLIPRDLAAHPHPLKVSIL